MTTNSDSKPPLKTTAETSAGGDDHIAHSLKRVYDDVANEPLPDRLVDLLDKLKKDGPE